MHPLKHPRNAAAVGLIFVIISALYFGLAKISGHLPIDYAGTTMLAILGIAMAVMAYVLIAGSPNE
jgi:hypothetical protein